MNRLAKVKANILSSDILHDPESLPKVIAKFEDIVFISDDAIDDNDAIQKIEKFIVDKIKVHKRQVVQISYEYIQVI